MPVLAFRVSSKALRCSAPRGFHPSPALPRSALRACSACARSDLVCSLFRSWGLRNPLRAVPRFSPRIETAEPFCASAISREGDFKKRSASLERWGGPQARRVCGSGFYGGGWQAPARSARISAFAIFRPGFCSDRLLFSWFTKFGLGILWRVVHNAQNFRNAKR